MCFFWCLNAFVLCTNTEIQFCLVFLKFIELAARLQGSKMPRRCLHKPVKRLQDASNSGVCLRVCHRGMFTCLPPGPPRFAIHPSQTEAAGTGQGKRTAAGSSGGGSGLGAAGDRQRAAGAYWGPVIIKSCILGALLLLHTDFAWTSHRLCAEFALFVGVSCFAR